MECGIIGLPGVGKTTLFSALTGTVVKGFSEKPNLGVARIPDPRLEVIATYVTTRKIVQATIQIVDIPGMPLRFSEFPDELALEAPFLGEHNEEVLRTYLSYTLDQVGELECDGVLKREPVREG